jgi:hypothetical protein
MLRNARPSGQERFQTVMKLAFVPILALLLLLAGGLIAAQSTREAGPTSLPAGATRPATSPSTDAPGPVRFGAVEVYVDPGQAPLAAYQFEVTARTGDVTLVGLEGGDHPAFKSAPYYDTRALLRDKVIVAAFSTAADLPRGRTRVATLMVQITGDAEPAYDARLVVAASADGKPIPAKVTLTPVNAPPAAAATFGAQPPEGAKQ